LHKLIEAFKIYIKTIELTCSLLLVLWIDASGGLGGEPLGLDAKAWDICPRWLSI